MHLLVLPHAQHCCGPCGWQLSSEWQSSWRDFCRLRPRLRRRAVSLPADKQKTGRPGNGGTIANATWVDSGAYGRALSFNGSDAVVTVDDSPSLHLRRAMTLEAWVKPSTIGGDWRDVVYRGRDAYYLEASSQADGLPMGGGSFNGAGGEGQVFGDDWLPTGAPQLAR